MLYKYKGFHWFVAWNTPQSAFRVSRIIIIIIIFCDSDFLL